MKKWVIGVVSSIVIVPILAGYWSNFTSAMEMSERQQVYEEAITDFRDYATQQMTTNELHRQEMDNWKEDQSRQWAMLQAMVTRDTDD